MIRTLRAWNIRIDEAFFLGGRDKGVFLKAFGADMFFDDQQKHCESARQHVATAHVPHGEDNAEGDFENQQKFLPSDQRIAFLQRQQLLKEDLSVPAFIRASKD